MPKYTVKAGDTVWALAKKALKAQGVANPSNAQINAMAKTARVPSGNASKINPGQTVTFSYSTRPTRSSANPARARQEEAAVRGRTGATGRARAATNPGAANRSTTAQANLTRARAAGMNAASASAMRAAGSSGASLRAGKPKTGLQQQVSMWRKNNEAKFRRYNAAR